MAEATRIETDEGWLSIDEDNKISLVDQIKKVPGLKYTIQRGGFYDEHVTVMVSDEVGKIIGLYMKANNYADMELFEFIIRMLGKDGKVK